MTVKVQRPSSAVNVMYRLLGGAILVCCLGLAPHAYAKACHLIKVRLAPMPGIGHFVPDVAKGLGYFREEGLDVKYVNVMNYVSDDFYSAKLLNNGTVDAEINWFQRVVFGTGNGEPLRAIFLLEDAPHITIFVANRVRNQVRSAADFRGRNVIDSEGFSTKRYITDLILQYAGVPINSYIPHPQWSHSAEETINAVKEGKADIVTAMEPQTSAIVKSGLMTPLYDLTTEAGTRKALGNIWLARAVYVSPQFIKQHPKTVQKLVNALTKAMRYINSHSADEIMAKIDPGYYAPDINNDDWAAYKKAKIDEVKEAYASFTRNDYSIPPSAAKFAVDTLRSSQFDNSAEGSYRRIGAHNKDVKVKDTYDNSFVEKAMAEIK